MMIYRLLEGAIFTPQRYTFPSTNLRFTIGNAVTEQCAYACSVCSSTTPHITSFKCVSVSSASRAERWHAALITKLQDAANGTFCSRGRLAITPIAQTRQKATAKNTTRLNGEKPHADCELRSTIRPSRSTTSMRTRKKLCERSQWRKPLVKSSGVAHL